MFKKHLLALFLMLLILPFGKGEEMSVSFYNVVDIFDQKPDEDVFFALNDTFFSYEPVHKGTTDIVLSGACAMHCASVTISNLKCALITAQDVATVNNVNIRKHKNWTNFVSWGKLENAYDVTYTSEDMVRFSYLLSSKGIKKKDRQQEKLNEVVRILDTYGKNTGIILHFNSSGKLNGSGKRHAVVLIGYIMQNGIVTDLILNDSSCPPPMGACTRLTDSSVPHSMIREKYLENLHGHDLALALMDDLVSYRYISPKIDKNLE